MNIMYKCPTNSEINDDILSMFTIIKTQPTLLSVPDVVDECGMDEEQYFEIKKHVTACASCKNVLKEYQQMQLVLEQVKNGKLEAFQAKKATA